MRTWLLAGLAVAACGAAMADTRAPTPPVISRAEQCLRDHVDGVVAEEPDIQSAARFLVSFACAKEVSAAIRYERNRVIVDQTTRLMASSDAAAHEPPRSPQEIEKVFTVDPETGDLVFKPTSPGTTSDAWFLTFVNGLGQTALLAEDPDPAPELRALAAELVMAAHERRYGPH